MSDIISGLYELIKKSENPIDFEERVRLYMYDLFAFRVGEMFTQLNDAVKTEKQRQGWKVKRNDSKTIQFTFGAVCFRHTLMHDKQGCPHYPFDEWMSFRKGQRYSPLVEVKTAELASEGTYRASAETLKEWTPVAMSHQTVGDIIKRVGTTQAQTDAAMVTDLEEAASLPEGKEVGYFYAEADGVFVRSTRKKQSHEVRHAIMHEGWDQNGKRVSLRNQRVIMTTQPADQFWNEVQALSVQHYSLEKAQVVTNSDGGQGYKAERFQEAFSQSQNPVINQLDAYHVAQGLNRALGAEKGPFKEGIRKALKQHDWSSLALWLDTYESTLTDEKQLEKVTGFRTYISHHWRRLPDWRDRLESLPTNARGLGAMESNQRHISFRMKRRGMHWSAKGSEAMVKVKQGMINQTLRTIYLDYQHRSARERRQVNKTVRMAEILRQPVKQSIGAKQGSIRLNDARSSAIGNLQKSLR